MKKYSRLYFFILLIGIALIITSCAPGNERFNIDDPAGFWMGLWHGFISLFTFIISLFSDNVTIYEVDNSGNWYNFGFILGVASFFGGGSKSSCSWK